MSMWQGVPDLRAGKRRRNGPTSTRPKPVTAGPFIFNTLTPWPTNKLFVNTRVPIEKPLFEETPHFRRAPWTSTRMFDHLPPHPNTVRPFDRPFTWRMKTSTELKEFHSPDFKSELSMVLVTPPPPVEAFHMTTKVILAISSLWVGCMVIMLACGAFVSRKKRRQGVVGAAPVNAGTVQQGKVTDMRPSEPEEPGPLNNDLPPPYYEFTPSMNIDEEPPPYNLEDPEQKHKQSMDQYHTNVIGFDAYIEEVDPTMRTELVFDNGRIVERLSLDGNSYNNETGVASNDNIQHN